VCCRARTREEQVKIFWQQADFGYVDERLQEMTMLCEPQKPVRALCSTHVPQPVGLGEKR